MLKFSITRALTVFFCCSFSIGVALADLPNGSFSKPTFDCTKVSSPLPSAICSSDEAANADWELVSAFWSLYFLMEERDRSGFAKAQEDWFASLPKVCALANPSEASSVRATGAQISCVTNQYRSRASGYRVKLSGDALAEATLSPDQHKQIQEALVSIDLLKSKTDGVFGLQTRNAIRQFQLKHQFPQTGYLSPGQRGLLNSQWATAIAGKKTEEPRIAPAEKPPEVLDRAPIISARPAQVQVEANSATTPPPSKERPSVKDDPKPELKLESAASSFAPLASSKDAAICDNVASADSAAACTRVISSEQIEGPDLVRLIMKRAASYEARKEPGRALADYNAVLLIDPGLKLASDGKIRTETAIRAQSPGTAAIEDAATQQPVDAASETSSLKRSASNPLFLLLSTVVLVSIALIALRFRKIGAPFRDGKNRRLVTSSALRIFGVCAGSLVAAAALGYLWFGSAQSLSAVASVARHIPLTSQAYLIVADVNSTLGAAKQFLEKTANMIDVSRLSKAAATSENDIRSNLARFQSVQNISLKGKDFTIANGCLDFASEADRLTMGLTKKTSAAGFISRQSDSSPVFVVGPVDQSRLSAFLASTSSRYLLDFSTREPIKDEHPIKLSIDKWQGTNLRLCNEKNRIAGLGSGSVLEVDSQRPHALATLDTLGQIAETATFDVGCSYEIQGKKRACRCKFWARGLAETNFVYWGDCSLIGKAFGIHTLSQQFLANAIKAGGLLPDSVTFDIPLVGPIQPSDQMLVRWEDDILVIGAAKALESSLAGTSGAAGASIIRDDTFVSFFERISVKPTAFLGAVRPDLYANPTFFNRLVSVPVMVSGLVDPDAIATQASINFEPLDAAILQDMSRDYSGAEGEIPINSSIGSASVRIGDDKVSQYVNFADRFILNRIVEGLSRLDTEDAIKNLRTNFVRYMLRKIGLKDDRAAAADDSFANQPHQIIVMDSPPDAWEPSIAVAVKFQSVGAARTFLCAEPSRLRENIDNRILLNAARAAKQETETTNRARDEYEEALKSAMEVSLGSAGWQTYQSRYEIDPFLMTIKRRADPALSEDPGCTTSSSDDPIDGQVREIYHLSPAVSESMKRFYYRIPAVIEAMKRDATRLDGEISRSVALLASLLDQVDPAAKAKADLTELTVQLKGKPKSDSLPPSLQELTVRLKAELDVIGEGGDLKDWVTIGDAQDDMGDGSLLNAVERRIVSIPAQQKSAINTLASERIQRAQILSEATRIEGNLSDDKQRVVAYIDEQRRLLFIANNLDVLKRASEQASQSKPVPLLKTDPRAERIRFYASGDNTVQSVLDVSNPEDVGERPRLWRNEKVNGPLLPFESAYAGLSGKTNGIVVSLNLRLRPTRKPAQ